MPREVLIPINRMIWKPKKKRKRGKKKLKTRL